MFLKYPDPFFFSFDSDGIFPSPATPVQRDITGPSQPEHTICGSLGLIDYNDKNKNMFSLKVVFIWGTLNFSTCADRWCENEKERVNLVSGVMCRLWPDTNAAANSHTAHSRIVHKFTIWPLSCLPGRANTDCWSSLLSKSILAFFQSNFWWLVHQPIKVSTTSIFIFWLFYIRVFLFYFIFVFIYVINRRWGCPKYTWIITRPGVAAGAVLQTPS